jgi:hypothetical protein
MVKTSCDPNEYPRFGFLSEEKIAEKASLLSTWIWENSKIPKGKLLQSDDYIRRIIDLVERRRILSIGHPCITNLIHAFTYRDISKESVMAIFETLIEIP